MVLGLLVGNKVDQGILGNGDGFSTNLWRVPRHNWSVIRKKKRRRRTDFGTRPLWWACVTHELAKGRDRQRQPSLTTRVAWRTRRDADTVNRLRGGKNRRRASGRWAMRKAGINRGPCSGDNQQSTWFQIAWVPSELLYLSSHDSTLDCV